MAASQDEIVNFASDPSSKVLAALVQGRLLTEKDVLVVANRKNVSADILETIAKDRKWAESYPVRLALVKNARTPLSISLSIARYLRIFDLEEITRNRFIPLVFRHKIESIITEQIPAMSLGNRKTLAKKAAGNVLLKLLLERHQEVVGLCLNNPHLTEAHLYKVLSRRDTRAETILSIANHPNWSARPGIRFSLVRNVHTPLPLSAGLLHSLTTIKLHELYDDPLLPPTIKPFIYRELRGRGRDPERAQDQTVFTIDVDEEVPRIDEQTDSIEVIEVDEEKNKPDDSDVE